MYIQYYSAIKMKPCHFATVWVDLEGIMPRETSQRNSNVCNLNRQTIEKQTPQTQRWWPEGETGEGDEEGQTCSDKISTSRGRKVQHGERGRWSGSNSVWRPVVTPLLQIIFWGVQNTESLDSGPEIDSICQFYFGVYKEKKG